MHKITMALFAVALPLLSLGNASAQEARQSFGFESVDVGGAVRLTGGGSYDPLFHDIKGGGSFRCTSDVTSGLLAGCKTGQGVRWSAVSLLDASGFKCGAPNEAGKTAVTGDDTVVLVADFYKQGDGDDAKITAKMFVSGTDRADDVGGAQKGWIQTLGCGDAIATFN